MTPKFVIIESPYGNENPLVVARNIQYARACVNDVLLRGEIPVSVSHLLYTQPGILDDNNPEERKKGIEAGLVLGSLAPCSIFYIDYGMSRGMEFALKEVREKGRDAEMRLLGSDWKEKFYNRFIRHSQREIWNFTCTTFL